jgi:hypothetical protein
MDCNDDVKEANKDKAMLADLYYERDILNALSGVLTKPSSRVRIANRLPNITKN